MSDDSSAWRFYSSPSRIGLDSWGSVSLTIEGSVPPFTAGNPVAYRRQARHDHRCNDGRATFKRGITPPPRVKIGVESSGELRRLPRGGLEEWLSWPCQVRAMSYGSRSSGTKGKAHERMGEVRSPPLQLLMPGDRIYLAILVSP